MRPIAIATTAALFLTAVVSAVGGGWLGLLMGGAWLLLARGQGVGNETPPGGSTKLPGVLVGVVLLAALMLRWPIASHDVEHYPGPDEGEVVENVLEMIRAGDLDHRHRGYPGLHFYLQLLPAHAHLSGTGLTIPELPRAGFYLAARRTTLVAGAFTALVVFWIGTQYLSPWSALLAAALVAFSPLAFRESAVVNPDLVMSLFVSMSLLLSLRLLEHRSQRAFLLAGASVGLAAAIKYTGALALTPYLAAWVLGPHRRADSGKALWGMVASGVAFATTSPYTLLNLRGFVEGLSMHVGYYRAAQLNAPYELTRQVVTRGVGAVASVAAFFATVRALSAVERHRLVVLAYPLSYWALFAGFDRAYPRHALPLIPMVALLSADGVERIVRGLSSRRAWAGPVLATVAGVLLLTSPILADIDLASRLGRETPADRALTWARENLPRGSRVLTDQYTPSFASEGFRTHRLRVEEKQFVGNYDWVFYSGYPPGLNPEGLREVARFDHDDALGDPIVLYQVPERGLLMPARLGRGEAELMMGAGELLYFGEGWDPPQAGAFDTSRLSNGPSAEIFFVLSAELVADLVGELRFEPLQRTSVMRVVVNGGLVAALTVENAGPEPVVATFDISPAVLANGLNRIELEFDELVRLDRRRPEAAIRFYSLGLSKR